MVRQRNYGLHTSQLILLALLFLFIQGCQKPFVNVEVVASTDRCAEGQLTVDDQGRVTGFGACPPPTPVTTTINHPDGITCESGHICKAAAEGMPCFGRGPNAWKCDTQQPEGETSCYCTCTPNPD
jgi:hypothetical protein